ncbi:DUF1501 domain-containing protein [Fuerstiella marisgermanici]|uniref:Sulfatase n=1 Tax=Fuerstiella marisgermanici TaxID=1891926 RepID=A0A1P8WJM5_9PLAN|nr:DUF1501 domain-containing protein [Fuerstiella marisgermanici]APZ94253.1 hypothetical protein Fuma_03878 [Fuerstiella marisgermanici]
MNTFNTLTRRQLFSRGACGIGAAALGSLANADATAAAGHTNDRSGILPPAHFRAKAKRVIYLFMHGGPSQMEMFDYKPALRKMHGVEIPDSVRGQQRLTGMTSKQDSLPIASPQQFTFRQHGESGAWVSDLMPHLAQRADDICFIKSMHTEAINHDPAVTYLQTGHQQPGRPSLGAWSSYGLGSENANLPAFVVLISDGSASRPTDPLYARLWGTGFLPSNHQGVNFRKSGDPVLYLSDAKGIDSSSRRLMLDGLASLNRQRFESEGDPEILTRIEQYEMAYRMQTSVPELTDLSNESADTLRMYGSDVTTPGTYAANCLLARRLAERDVRFIQLYHRGWDQHYNLPSDIRLQCGDIDQPTGALLTDLKQRGLLKDTLIVWGGEFGRTAYSQGKLSSTDYGRDHHGRCFTMWMAGGGIKPGVSYGETDDLCYNVASNPVHVHDLNATILRCMGIDHKKLTFRFQGRDYRLTDVEGNVVKEILV